VTDRKLLVVVDGIAKAGACNQCSADQSINQWRFVETLLALTVQITYTAE